MKNTSLILFPSSRPRLIHNDKGKGHEGKNYDKRENIGIALWSRVCQPNIFKQIKKSGIVFLSQALPGPKREYPEANVNLTYIQQSGQANTLTDGGDIYTGLDRFGRVIDLTWWQSQA